MYKFSEKVSNFKDNLTKVALDLGIPAENITKDEYIKECDKLGLTISNIQDAYNYEALKNSVVKHVKETLYSRKGTTSPLRQRNFLRSEEHTSELQSRI